MTNQQKFYVLMNQPTKSFRGLRLVSHVPIVSSMFLLFLLHQPSRALVGGLAYQRISVGAFGGYRIHQHSTFALYKNAEAAMYVFISISLHSPYLVNLFINLFTRILISDENRPTVVPT